MFNNRISITVSPFIISVVVVLKVTAENNSKYFLRNFFCLVMKLVIKQICTVVLTNCSKIEYQYIYCFNIDKQQSHVIQPCFEFALMDP